MTLLNCWKWCVVLGVAASCRSAPLANNGASDQGGGSVAPPGTGGARTAGTGGAATAGTGGAESGTGGVGGTAGIGDETADAGTSASPTIALVSVHDYDVYCGLKAGQMKCWTSSVLDHIFDAFAASRTVAGAPPDLTQIAIAGSGSAEVMTACGIEQDGLGSCWLSGARNLGDQLLAVAVSRFGTCALTVAGALSCSGIDITGLPANAHYKQIAASEDLLAALDEDGNAFFPYLTLPAGVYTEVVTNDARQFGAVRTDGAVVYFPVRSPTVPIIKPGSFVHLALDYAGDACAIDRAGEITCWPDQGTPVPLGASDLPRGPFTAIVGAEVSFCALRRTGTTACWGRDMIEVPPDW